MHKVRRASSDMARDPQSAHKRPGAAHRDAHTIRSHYTRHHPPKCHAICDCEPGTPLHPRESVRRLLTSMHKVRHSSSDTARDPHVHTNHRRRAQGTHMPFVHTTPNPARPNAELSANKYWEREPCAALRPILPWAARRHAYSSTYRLRRGARPTRRRRPPKPSSSRAGTPTQISVPASDLPRAESAKKMPASRKARTAKEKWRKV